MKEPALFAWILANTSNDCLQNIAAADYGLHQDAHLVALRQIASGDLSSLLPLRSCPGEVLELACHGSTEAASSEPAPLQPSIRLFTSLVLLYAEASAENFGHAFTTSNNLIAAVDAVKTTFPNKQSDLLDFLDVYLSVQKNLNNSYFGHDGLFQLARFLLVVEQTPLASNTLEALTESIENDVQKTRSATRSFSKKPRGRYGWVLKAYNSGQPDRALWIRHLDAAANRLRHQPTGEQLAAWLDGLAERKE